MANKLVARLCVMFGTPETQDPAAWFSEMDKLLKGYSDEVLDRAANIVLRNHRLRAFPSVSVMLGACEEAREAMSPRRQEKDPYEAWSPARVSEADRMLNCDLGREAAADGWVFAMHSFIRENRRLPNRGEIGRLKAISVDFDEKLKDCVEGRGGQFGDALIRLGTSMLERRSELAKKAHGGMR